MWAAVTSDGSKFPLVFDGVKVNTEVYIKMLTEKVLTLITKSFGIYYMSSVPLIEFDPSVAQRLFQRVV